MTRCPRCDGTGQLPRTITNQQQTDLRNLLALLHAVVMEDNHQRSKAQAERNRARARQKLTA